MHFCIRMQQLLDQDLKVYKIGYATKTPHLQTLMNNSRFF